MTDGPKALSVLVVDEVAREGDFLAAWIAMDADTFGAAEDRLEVNCSHIRAELARCALPFTAGAFANESKESLFHWINYTEAHWEAHCRREAGGEEKFRCKRSLLLGDKLKRPTPRKTKSSSCDLKDMFGRALGDCHGHNTCDDSAPSNNS